MASACGGSLALLDAGILFHSFITEIYIAPLQGYYSEALPIHLHLHNTSCLLASRFCLGAYIILPAGHLWLQADSSKCSYKQGSCAIFKLKNL